MPKATLPPQSRRLSMMRRLLLASLLQGLLLMLGLLVLVWLLFDGTLRQLALQPGPLSPELLRSIVIQQALLLWPWLAAVLLLPWLCFWFLAHLATRPIARLLQASMALQRGELGTQVSVGVGDEIGELAENLNSMSRALLESSRSLEQQNRALTNSVHRLEGLLQVGQVLSSTSDGEHLIRRVASTLQSSFGYDRVGVALVERDALVYRYSSDGEAAVGLHLRVPLSERTVAGRAVLSSQPVLVSDLRSEPQLQAPEGLPGCRAELVVPVLHNDTVHAVLDIQSLRAGAFSDEDRLLISAFAGPLALALVNTGMLRVERLRVQLSDAIYRISQAPLIGMTPEVAAGILLDQLGTLINFERSGVLLLVDGNEQLIVRGAAAGELLNYELRPLLEHPQVARVRAEKRARSVATTSGSALIAPLIGQGRLNGLVIVETATVAAYDADVLTVAVVLAAHTGLLIDNLRLQADTQDVNRLLKVISELTAAITSNHDLHSMLRTIVQQIRKVVSCDLASIATYNSEDDSFILETYYDVHHPGSSTPELVPAEGTPWKMVYNAGQPIYQRDLRRSAFERDQELAQRGMLSSVVIPIVADGLSVGTLNLASRQQAAFSENQVHLLVELARYFATALRNARLIEQSVQVTTRLAQTEQYLNFVEKLRAIGQLASGIAHDFNNLLAAVLGNAQLLLLEVHEPDQRQLLKVIEQAARDGAETVRRMQSFARTDHSGAMAPVRMDFLARDALELTRPRWRDMAQSRGIVLTVERRLEVVPPIAGHPAELREVLTNLIINAVDAMPRGGTLTVSTFVDPDPEDHVVVEVRDTGIGMSPEVRARIFEAFFTTKGQDGTGLGLSVSYSIAQRHGGAILVDSEEGVGSIFQLRLPVRTAETSHEEEEELPDLPALRLLVVEAEPMVRSALVRVLNHWGHQVDEATCGADALALFEIGRYDLVICDLGMPDMSGRDLLQVLRERDAEAATVLLTGWSVQPDLEPELAGLVDHVLPKPFDQRDLRRALGRALRT